VYSKVEHAVPASVTEFHQERGRGGRSGRGLIDGSIRRGWVSADQVIPEENIGCVAWS